MGKIRKSVLEVSRNSAWSRCFTVQLTTFTFRAIGIYPLNIEATPEHAYLLGWDNCVNQVALEIVGLPTESRYLQFVSTAVLATTTEIQFSSILGLSTHPLQHIILFVNHQLLETLMIYSEIFEIIFTSSEKFNDIEIKKETVQRMLLTHNICMKKYLKMMPLQKKLKKRFLQKKGNKELKEKKRVKKDL